MGAVHRRHAPGPARAGPGWSQQIEDRGDRVVHPVPPGSLVEFLAVRLLLDRFALAYAAREALGLRRARSPGSATRCRGRIERPLAAERRAARLPGLPARPGRRALARPAPSAGPRPSGSTIIAGDRVLHGRWSGGGSSTWPTSGGSTPRRSTRSPCTPEAGRRRPDGRGSRRSSASTSARSRSAATWRSWPRRRDLRHGRLLLRRRCTIAGRPTPTSSPLCPVGDPAAALGRRGGRRPVERDRRRRARTRRLLGMASHRFHIGSRSLDRRRAARRRRWACWPRSRWSPAPCSRG